MTEVFLPLTQAGPLVLITLGLYALALLAYLVSPMPFAAAVPGRPAQWAASFFFAAAWAADVCALVFRGLSSLLPGTFPEALIAFIFWFGLAALVTERILRTRMVGALACCFILGAALVAVGKPEAAAPALSAPFRSAWFLPHVTLQIAGFGCVTMAATLALRWFLKPGGPDRDLEASALRWTRAGFLLLGAALVTGAFWTRQVWGGIWPHSPREQWGLFALLVFMAVLHVPRVPEYRGRAALGTLLAGWSLALAGLILAG